MGPKRQAADAGGRNPAAGYGGRRGSSLTQTTTRRLRAGRVRLEDANPVRRRRSRNGRHRGRRQRRRKRDPTALPLPPDRRPRAAPHGRPPRANRRAHAPDIHRRADPRPEPELARAREQLPRRGARARAAGSLLAPALIHGAGLAVCWLAGALAARSWEREAFTVGPAEGGEGEGVGLLGRYGTVLSRLFQAGAFASGVLILSTQTDLLLEFGRYVQYGESDSTDLRLAVATVEVASDIFWEAVVIGTYQVRRARAALANVVVIAFRYFEDVFFAPTCVVLGLAARATQLFITKSHPANAVRFTALRANCFATIPAKEGSHVKGRVLAEILEAAVTRESLSRVRVHPRCAVCPETFAGLVRASLAVEIPPPQDTFVLS
ncbi:hypothetical protein THAOC_11966 [Thalassiosira oceanica]|uniref:Uncharacterized protein n=1 Tax=Thalassiosira oceanica TaxID=159749 RepID=K0T926_THAOC|nr:hypothetical protein THAOC_11966 [Thalassiosira oceanica]|eukprot:EJK67047.1 hypothetical protein THAOC_11966 [Thalassiosira oceanica]